MKGKGCPGIGVSTECKWNIGFLCVCKPGFVQETHDNGNTGTIINHFSYLS